MRASEQDNEQLGILLRYCGKIEDVCQRFGSSYADFEAEELFQDCCSFYLIQIGEAAHRLSEDFRTAHPEMEWSRIYGMRCRLVHGYEAFDPEIAWDVIDSQIPPLKAFCEERFRP